MPAYAIFIREKTRDRAALDVYTPLAQASIEGRPLKVLAAYGGHQSLEGPELEGVVMLEFPSMEEARAWYDSPAYREAREHRFRGADYRAFIVEGLAE
jgi:uncharacterized protein (DUF1330 family)